MAVIELNRTPTAAELRWFGVIILAFFGVLGALISWQTESPGAGATLWGIGAGLAALYYGVPPLRRPLYGLWMAAVFPIGWLVSHILLGAIYFLVITPIALVARAFGRDKLARKLGPSSASYWIEESPGGDTARYFRQY